MNALGRYQRRLLVAVVFSFVCINTSAQAPTNDTDLCSLVAKPDAFKDKTVRIRARVISSVEGAAVFDGSCAQQGIALWIEKSAREHSDIRQLDAASMATKGSRAAKKIVTATLTAKFLLRPDKQPRLVLEAVKVENIDVKEERPDGH